MDLGLQGKVALVSGGSSGVGLANARKLTAEGARVMLVARGEDRLAAAAAEIAAIGGGVAYVSADMTTKEGVDKAVEQRYHSGPDIAIGSVATTRRFGFDDCSDDDFRLACEEVVMATVFLARAVIPSMKAAGWGRFLSISTVAVKEPHRTLHVTLANTFRPGQQGLTKALSNEYSEFGITFNKLLLGRIDTGRHQSAVSSAAGRGVPELAEPEPRIPVGRPGLTDEVSAVCVFLCSEPASYITGQAIAVDGGWLRGLV